MIKTFDTTTNQFLSIAIGNLETSLKCPKYLEISDQIRISVPNDIVFQRPENKEASEKGFGTCLTKLFPDGSWDALIIINLKNCVLAKLTEREVAAVIVHELGHLLNEPELLEAPTFEFCFINGIQFCQNALDAVHKSNAIATETFADSYAKLHGYGNELISSFHKQNENFDQKIGLLDIRIAKLLSPGFLEGNISARLRRGQHYNQL